MQAWLSTMAEAAQDMPLLILSQGNVEVWPQQTYDIWIGKTCSHRYGMQWYLSLVGGNCIRVVSKIFIFWGIENITTSVYTILHVCCVYCLKSSRGNHWFSCVCMSHTVQTLKMLSKTSSIGVCSTVTLYIVNILICDCEILLHAVMGSMCVCAWLIEPWITLHWHRVCCIHIHCSCAVTRSLQCDHLFTIMIFKFSICQCM